MKAELIDYMGDDLSVVNAARVSFDKVSELELKEMGGIKNRPDIWGLYDKDVNLIRFLAKHDHWTPFAHTAISLRMEAPVPIRTQCFKHKVGMVENEESRRYISSTPKVFVPIVLRNAPINGAKQGSSGVHYDSDQWLFEYQEAAHQCISLYNGMIADGVCPEQARFVLPQGCEVHWVWTGNLLSFSNFFNKRTDPHAQCEIQDLAHMVGQIIEPLFPVSWKALTE